MVILHIASIHDNPFSGVVNAVPNHVIGQQELETVWYINIKNRIDERIKKQIEYDSNLRLKEVCSKYGKPDIVVFHELYHVEFTRLAKECEHMNIPYIIVPHGGLTKEAQKQKRMKKIIGNICFFNRYIKRASSIHFLSYSERQNSRTVKNSFITPNGIKIPDVYKVAFNTNSIRFTYIGRIDIEIKGLDLMLKAVADLRDTIEKTNCTFEIYGPDYKGSTDRLKKMIEELSLTRIVQVYPAISGKQKRDVLLNTDIYIQTSRSEGLPQGILEAMAYGIPCLVTQGTNLGDVIEANKAGWVAETREKSIAQSISQAIHERDNWKVISEQSRRTAETYSWDSIAKNTINYYAEILKNRT